MKQNLNGAVAANRRNTSMMDIKLLQLIKKKNMVQMSSKKWFGQFVTQTQLLLPICNV